MHHLPARLFPLFALLLAACQQQPAQPAERIALDQVPEQRETVLPSPVTTRALWTVSDNGRAIHFADPGAAPLVTLDCRMSPGNPPNLAIIRHAIGFPGQTALFALIGNRKVSRLPADAVLAEGEWRWESVLAAVDPQLDLFIGSGDIRATLPGKGAVEIPPSPIPGEFIAWCRAGGLPATAGR